MDEKVARLYALKAISDMIKSHRYGVEGVHNADDALQVVDKIHEVAGELRRERLSMLESLLDKGYMLTPPAPGTTVYSRQEDAIKSSEIKGFYGSPVSLDEAVEVANDAFVATIERTIENWTPTPADMPTIIETSEPAQEEIKPSTLRWRLVREYNAGATTERRAEIEAILREKAGLRIVYDTTRSRFEATPVDKPLGAGRVEKEDAPGAPESETVQEVNGVKVVSDNPYKLIKAFNEAGANLVARQAISRALKELGYKPFKAEDSKVWTLAEIDRDTPAPDVVVQNMRPGFIEKRAFVR